jgi:hypothetical protein
MSNAGRSVLVFGIYPDVLEMFLLISPNPLITRFGLPTTHAVWIRVGGMLPVCLAYYDIQAARRQLTAFSRWSVYARADVIVFFAVFALAGLVQSILLLVGAIAVVADV